MIRYRNIAAYLGVVAVVFTGPAYPSEQPGRLPAPVEKPAKVDKALYDTDDQTIIKKSRSDICHDRTSGSFNLTTNFKAYRTMKECLESGGRLPR